MTDLERFAYESPMADTHEHMRPEGPYLADPHDVLTDLFDHYVTSDLVGAGAAPKAVARCLDATDPDLEGRFRGIQDAWELTRHTGYGEGVSLIARRLYGLDEIVPEALAAANEKAKAMRSPGGRLRLLRDVANLDHVQCNSFYGDRLGIEWDPEQPDFFLQDLAVLAWVTAEFAAEEVQRSTGVEPTDLASLGRAMETAFDRFGPKAVAVKTQHAYSRTLAWSERTDAEAEAALTRHLAGKAEDGDRIVLGDWCLDRACALAAKHDLPVKIHTGYMAGWGVMDVDRVRASHLWALMGKHANTRFVLMHTSYPYTLELISLAKRYPNVFVDLCWAWCIDPRETGNFVRHLIHAVPANKLFAFGGDSWWPSPAVAYSIQARRGLAAALAREVEAGELTEPQAIGLASRFMLQNQEDCFRVSEKKRLALA